ncbi:hypothetical protein Nepgr_019039 [Nepenthes gracilis]|uniref:Pentatricopeptide repeat-containing protein n=1 Tax=Nepenthes gracilis TaxID=150966 RepID=A0AAD3STA5_NEPGR|nr:hypothetical protein Nepgr_019039 [Nepenthes gracilis]
MALHSSVSPHPHYFCSSLGRSLSLPSASRSFVHIPTTRRLNFSIRCSISQVYNYGSVDYERRPLSKWNHIYRRISLMENPEVGAASVMNQIEKEGKKITKWELCRVVRELRKYKKYQLALEVYEWMNNRIERFRLFNSDIAIQLDLVAKVRGISSAEDYFLRLPDSVKDKRIYGALLNAYVGAKMRDKAEPLMEQMRNKGYAVHPLPFNVMMTLYMKLGEYDIVDSLISEMKQQNIQLDTYSYNIWLSARGSQGSVEGMEEVFEQMKLDTGINPNWTTFSTMATFYIRLGQLREAEQCLKHLETRIVDRDRMPYHYLISLYGSMGNKGEVYRVWNMYKSVFPTIPNLGYYAIISSLLRMGEIQGAEKIYDEWMLAKSTYDPKIGNLLMGWYVKEGLFEKAESLFDQMAEGGGNPGSSTWEILAEGHIRQKRLSDALSCFKEAASAPGSQSWRPKPVNVTAMLELCKRGGNEDSKEALIELLRQLGCSLDETYPSALSRFSGIDDVDASYKLN